MPTPIAVGDILQVKAYNHQIDQAGINVRHYTCLSLSPDGVSLEELALDLETVLAPLYKACMTDISQHEGVGVSRIKPVPATVEVFDNSGAGVGTVGMVPLPAQVSGIITLQTGFAGRKFRGRVYIPFPDQSDNDVANNIPIPAYRVLLTGMASIYANNRVLIDGSGTSVFQPVIYHRSSTLFTPIVGFRVNLKWATQRRRGNYGRENPPHP